MRPQPAAPVSAKTIDSTAAAEAAADYGKLVIVEEFARPAEVFLHGNSTVAAHLACATY
jgi:hypothetical protein